MITRLNSTVSESENEWLTSSLIDLETTAASDIQMIFKDMHTFLWLEAYSLSYSYYKQIPQYWCIYTDSNVAGYIWFSAFSYRLFCFMTKTEYTDIYDKF